MKGHGREKLANVTHTVFIGTFSVYMKARRRYEYREQETVNGDIPHVRQSILVLASF